VPRGGRGAEQRAERFGVVVQADALLALSTVLVAPTSRSAPARSFRPVIDVEGQLTRVLLEHVTVVAPERLGESVGRLSAGEQSNVDNALALVLGL
jgi:mRNA interferase MazF